jgi:hypothetical protein
MLDQKEWGRNYGWYGTLICEVVEEIRMDRIDALAGGRILAAIELAKRTSGY